MIKDKLPAKLTGKTTRFRGKGRQLGYPTANIHSPTKLADGVYFGLASLGKYKAHPTLIFIGTPTTVGDTQRRVEAHLLDIPDKDYYEQTLEVEIQHYHRANQTFSSIGELIKAIKNDEQAARRWFKSITNY